VVGSSASFSALSILLLFCVAREASSSNLAVRLTVAVEGPERAASGRSEFGGDVEVTDGLTECVVRLDDAEGAEDNTDGGLDEKREVLEALLGPAASSVGVAPASKLHVGEWGGWSRLRVDSARFMSSEDPCSSICC
jgi:hypothetical protein